MNAAHEVIADYIAVHAIDLADFWTWSADAGHDEVGLNVHDSTYLACLENYVEDRDSKEPDFEFQIA